MNRPIYALLALVSGGAAYATFGIAPHITDPAPFATLGQAYVVMVATGALLVIAGCCFACAALTRD